VVKKEVVVVPSTEAFPMARLTLQVEIPMTLLMTNIPGLAVGEEC
jgi:hypothetical protein